MNLSVHYKNFPTLTIEEASSCACRYSRKALRADLIPSYTISAVSETSPSGINTVKNILFNTIHQVIRPP